MNDRPVGPLDVAVGVIGVVAGASLLLFYRDADFGPFPGWLLGVLVLLVGAADLARVTLRR